MRLLPRAVVLAVLVASCLPLGGCVGLVIGLTLGSASGHAQGVYDAERRDDVERWVCAATLAESPRDRWRALFALRRAYRSPPVFDPARVREEADERIARIAEALEDEDSAVAAEARRLLADMVGETVSVAAADLDRLRRPSPLPDDTTRWAAQVESADAFARGRVAALRAYGLLRLGGDASGMLPFLREGLAVHEDADRGFDESLAVACALALSAAGPEAARDAGQAMPALLAALEGRTCVTGHEITSGWFSKGLLARSTGGPGQATEPALAAAIALGRLGPDGASARDALREAEGSSDLRLRKAASHALARIGARNAPR